MLKNMCQKDGGKEEVGIKLNSVTQILTKIHGPQILKRQDPVSHEQAIVRYEQAKKQRKKFNGQYLLMQFKQKICVKGQGEYELTVNNLMNPYTMKSITPDGAFLKQSQIRAIKNRQLKEQEEKRMLQIQEQLNKREQELKQKEEKEMRLQQIKKLILPKLLRKVMNT